MKKYKAGVLFGEELEALYNDAKENQFAMPAVNTIGTDSINATLETAAKVNSPVIIQFSNGGAQFIAGKGMPNDKMQANISGGISGALHIHNVAKYYGVPVILHTDHASKKWLPWISGLLDAGEQRHLTSRAVQGEWFADKTVGTVQPLRCRTGWTGFAHGPCGSGRSDRAG